MNTTALKKIAADLKEWYLFKRSKKTIEEWTMHKWREANINVRANNIRDYMPNCKYIVEVDYFKITGFDPMFGDYVKLEFREQFSYPYRPIEEHCCVAMMRGLHVNDSRIFENNEIAGGDSTFIGTNSKEDATMIALLYK